MRKGRRKCGDVISRQQHLQRQETSFSIDSLQWKPLWAAARRPRDKQVKLHGVMPGTVNFTKQRLSDSNYDIH